MSYSFEWDEEKNASNYRKHGIGFESATDAFKDAFCIEEIDDTVYYGEERYKLTGSISGKVVVVVYTERGDSIRIISARYATRVEHDRYYRENSQE